MRSHPQITHGDQALALEPVIGHSGLRRQCPRQVPVALAAETGQYPDLMAEVLIGALGPTQLGPPESESEQHAIVGLCHPAFVLVDHQPEPAGQEARDACHDPFARAVALHQDQQVVRIADKPMTPALQFLVQVVQQNVGSPGD